MVRRTAAGVSETELAMLQVLWEQRGGDPAQVADTLYPGGGESHYATVQKLLERLEKKGFVRHERRDGILVFEVTLDRDEFLEAQLQELAEKLCGGAMAPR